MEIKIIKEQLPQIEINFDELKLILLQELKKYENVVVTEESLQGCKQLKKQLSSLRNRIDAHRKAKKKELTAPIKAFENQCKELEALIQEVQKPIEEGIKVYDDKRREEKRQQAEHILQELLAESGLESKYADMVQMKSEYSNISVTKKFVKEDIQAQIQQAKEKRDADIAKIDTIKAVIESQNEPLNRKMKIEDFHSYMEMDISTIIAEINRRAKLIYEAEHPAIEEPIEKPVEKIAEKPAKESEAVPETPEMPEVEMTVCQVVLRGDAGKIDYYLDVMEAEGIHVKRLVEF